MDPSSSSNPDAVRVKHLDINWNVDFTSKTISGIVTLDVEVLVDGSTELVLDASASLAGEGVDISKVTVDGVVSSVTRGPPRGALGVALKVELPLAKRAAGSTLAVVIPYRIGTESSALQFLSPEQTGGKVHPFLFTQCQAIHARSLLPVQDT